MAARIRRAVSVGRSERIGLYAGACPLALVHELAVIGPHRFAALRTRRVNRVAFQLRDERADLFHALRIEPAPSYAAADSKQVRFRLAGADELMPTFMGVDIELHLGGESLDLGGVHDEKAWKSAAPAIELRIENGRARPAIDPNSVDGHFAVGDFLGLRAGLIHILLDAGSLGPVTAKDELLRGRGLANTQRRRGGCSGQKRTPEYRFPEPHLASSLEA